MTKNELVNDLQRCIAHINPDLDIEDIRHTVPRGHLINVVVNSVSRGMFPKNPTALGQLLSKSRDTEDFLRGLQAVAFDIPTGDELLKALQSIKNGQTTEHKDRPSPDIYAEVTGNGC